MLYEVITLQIVQMNSPPRLDRLSALLEGLAPRVQVSRALPGSSSLSVAADAATFSYNFV